MPSGTRTRHEDRVPNPSRWTQFAALGRSSPSGMRWSARTRRKAATTASPSAGVPSASRTRSTLGEGSPRERFSRTWIPGGRLTAVGPATPVKSTKNSDVRSPTSSHDPL